MHGVKEKKKKEAKKKQKKLYNYINIERKNLKYFVYIINYIYYINREQKI